MTELEITARHEAAHAVMAYQFNLYIASVSIDETDDSIGVCRIKKTRSVQKQVMLLLSGIIAEKENDKEPVEDYIIRILQKMLSDGGRGPNDIIEALCILKGRYPDNSAKQFERFMFLLRKANRISKKIDFQNNVTMLAGELMKRRKIGGEVNDLLFIADNRLINDRAS